MTTWRVTLDGGETQPERSGEITVEADSADQARETAERNNPGLTAVAAEQLDDSDASGG